MIGYILNPVNAILRKISLAKKFFLIILLYAMPIAYQLWVALEERREEINNALEEIETLDEVSQFLPLQINIAKTRGYNNASRNGNELAERKVLAQIDEVEKLFNHLLDDARSSPTLKPHISALKALHAQWKNTVSHRKDIQPIRVFDQFSHLNNELFNLSKEIAFDSALKTDPVRDTSFLIEANINVIPPLIDLLGQTRGIGAGIAAKGKFESDSFIRLSNLYNRLTQLSKEFNYSLEKFMQLDDDNAALAQSHARAKSSIRQFLTVTNSQLLEPDTLSITSDQYFSEGTASIKAVNELYTISNEMLTHHLAEQERDTRQMMWINLTSSLLLIIAALLFFGSFYQTTIKAVTDISNRASLMAKGDMRQEFQVFSEDEIGQISVTLNKMSSTTREMVSEVIDASKALVHNAGQNLQSATDTRHQVAEQTNEVEMVATAVNQMSASIQEVSKNARDTADSSQQADEESNQGMLIVNNTIQSISELASELNQAAESIRTLQDDVNNIGAVLDVIQGIADQTNLLALNAAIEAARAGESGRGFAVVADEVRTLASKTQTSTEEIRNMIEKLVQSASDSVSAIEKGNLKSEQTVKDATEAGQALQRITESVNQISLMSEQISSAALEQSTVAEEVNQSVIRVRDLAEKTNQSATNSAEVSEELDKIASRLEKVCKNFQV